jgi:Cu/Ag efflux protein CusF
MIRNLTFALLLAVLAFGLSGCGEQPSAEQSTEASQPKGMERGEHALTGTIEEVQTEEGVLIVKHDDIPDVMGPMTMGFKIADQDDLSGFKVGQQISAKLVVQGNNMWLEDVKSVE